MSSAGRAASTDPVLEADCQKSSASGSLFSKARGPPQAPGVRGALALCTDGTHTPVHMPRVRGGATSSEEESREQKQRQT